MGLPDQLDAAKHATPLAASAIIEVNVNTWTAVKAAMAAFLSSGVISAELTPFPSRAGSRDWASAVADIHVFRRKRPSRAVATTMHRRN